MTKRCILVGCLALAVCAFAQSGAEMKPVPAAPDSNYLQTRLVDSVGQKAAGEVDAEAARRAQLMEWLRAALLSPGHHRVVIDGGQLREDAPTPVGVGESVLIPWENSAVVHWKGEPADSFLVSVSATGCPGRPSEASVGVSFATPSGWSHPPIRFGPVVEHTICPLGEGFELEVLGGSEEGSRVRLSSRTAAYGSRK
jgi:hypothetical protein